MIFNNTLLLKISQANLLNNKYLLEKVKINDIIDKKRSFDMNKLKHVDIYTDGACSGNPGPGGWGAVLRYGSNELEISGGEPHTTNNRMELTALISA